MAGCSWQDMGLTPVQNYVDIVAADAVSKSNMEAALTRPLGHGSLTQFDNDVFRSLPSTSTARFLTPTSYSHEPAHGSMGSVETWRNNVVPVHGQMGPPVTLRPGSELPWPAPSKREVQDTKEEPRRTSSKYNEPYRVPQGPQNQGDPEHSYGMNDRPGGHLAESGSSTIHGKRTNPSSGKDISRRL